MSAPVSGPVSDPAVDPGLGLAREVHLVLNATATPRTPDPADLPPRDDGSPVALPRPAPPRGDVGAVLAARRSSYRFGGPPDLDELGAALHHGLARAPRAGGLPSLTAYVVAREGPLTGVHRADLRLPVASLVPVRRGDPTAYLAASLDQPPFATRAPTWVALTADLRVVADRYPARHYRTLHVDAGAALQATLTVAAALGLRACPVSGFDDTAWERLLDLDADQLVTVVVALGRSAEATG